MLTPGSAATRARKASPRTSKLRNWSNEAQAGERSTTGSPPLADDASRALVVRLRQEMPADAVPFETALGRPSGVSVSLCAALGKVPTVSLGISSLSPREFEILRLILEARSVAEIAAALNISVKTVNNYHYLIKHKLDVATDIELLYLGLRHGLVAAPTSE